VSLPEPPDERSELSILPVTLMQAQE
jgi:CheY-like chemotaxis protein